jgi:hypothetical protein
VKIRVSQRLSKVNYEFVPVPSNLDKLIPDATLAKFWKKLLELWRKGISDPSVRLLASLMEKSERSIQRYQRALESMGMLAKQLRRVLHNRNDTNVYTLMGFQVGVGDKNVVEKKGESTNTTTPPASPAGLESINEVKPSKTRLEWEARQAKDAADHGLRLQGWVDRGKLWLGMQQWRLAKAYERNRMALQARIGVYDGPQMSDEEVIEVRERMARREAERKGIILTA